MKRLLIVVDYQNDFVDGSLGFPGAELLEEPIAAKIEEYRSAADVIAFTFDTHRCDYLETQEGRNLPVEHCIEGAPGHALYGRIAELIRPTDEVFEKPSFGSQTCSNGCAQRSRRSRASSWWASCPTSA